MSDVAGAIVAHPLRRFRQLRRRAKAFYERLNHHLANELTADSGGSGCECDSLAVAAVPTESNTDTFAVVTTDLEAVRAIALIAALYGDDALMGQAERGRARMPQAQQSMSFRKPIDPA